MATRLSIHSVYTSIVYDWAPGGRVPVGLRSKTSLAGYVFINDQLVRALYVVDQNHTDLIGYLSDYQHLKRALTEKYGQPAKDEEVWPNDLYKDKPRSMGRPSLLGI